MAIDEHDRTGNCVCKHLRSKEMFYQSETAEDQDFASGLFWCTHSQNCLGPDGRAAGDEECLPGRSCYEV